jgi:phage tail-like protein
MAEDRVSTYLVHLPALLQNDAFVGHFLLAFERILSGLHPSDPQDPLTTHPGLEDVIARLYTYFVPGPREAEAAQAPEAFLPWLASWVALSVREDWTAEEKRRLISRIVALYRYRGTRRGVEDLLHTYTNEDVVIYEFDAPAHYFQVEMTLREPTPERRGRIERIARAMLEQEKPAHTVYALRILTPTMRIMNADREHGIRVGQTTLLGTTSERGAP